MNNFVLTELCGKNISHVVIRYTFTGMILCLAVVLKASRI